MTEAMQQFQGILPWLVIIIQFAILSYIILRVVTVLDHALARAQSTTAPAQLPPTGQPGTVSPPVVVAPPPQAKPPTPAPATPVVDQGLVNFVKKEEGFTPTAQWDYKQYTYGYGTKAPGAGATIDEADAEKALTVEIAAANKAVDAFAKGLPKGVEQALTDLTFNAGSGWEQGSLGAAVLMALKTGDWSHVKADILQYDHAGGQVLAALTKRREAEVSWFDNPL